MIGVRHTMGKIAPFIGSLACAAMFAAQVPAAPQPPASDGQAAGPATEAELKVAFLLNFARFVKWPGPPPAEGTPFVVGVLDMEPLRQPLSELEKANVRGRPFKVRHCRGTNDVEGCHILLLNAPEPEVRTEFLNEVRKKPVLTVGESPDFLAEGGIIRFVLSGERLRLHISRQAAARAGLELSARLLEVAEKVFNGN